MIQAFVRKYTLHFHRPATTSRGTMQTKDSWFIVLSDSINPGKKGIGECGLLRGLSIDDRPGYEEKINSVAEQINKGIPPQVIQLQHFPSIRFGLEMALLDLGSDKERILFPSSFTGGKASIAINGLVWMGSYDYMQQQIREKIGAGYRCIKLKIGAIDFEQELSLIRQIRKDFKAGELEIRVDANGAFSMGEALNKLKRLAEFDLHSIEQPIRQRQWERMAELCEKTPLPIALDEELIGISGIPDKRKLLEMIRPQYIIIKPSLVGGFAASEEWIGIAERQGIGWWVTSALESNIGLNAIAQWTYTLEPKMPQGLGTGQLYNNNFESPLKINNGKLMYIPDFEWRLMHNFTSNELS